MRALIAGWFSFEGMGATAGDLMARDVARAWLEAAGFACDVAGAPPFEGVDWREVAPERYSVVVFVCGPFGNGGPIPEFIARFRHARLVGLDVSMLESLERWNPFDVLFERDSDRASRPDLSLLAAQTAVPVVGVILVHPQSEYGDRGRHDEVNAAVERLLASREVARVVIDTRLDENATGLRTPAEVESLIARMDAVVTTRLHGTVLAIKHGVPPLVIDPIAGGAKVIRQAEALGWPHAFRVDDLNEGVLREALDLCLSPEGRAEAIRCRDGAREELSGVRDALLAELAATRERVV
jgi:Polysaccharide pyruvyl transferase